MSQSLQCSKRSDVPFYMTTDTMYTLIVTAKMNDIDPQAWLADVLARLPDMPVSRIHELLPWNWKTRTLAEAA